METIDLTKEANISFEKINHDYESSDEAARISDEANDIVDDLKKIREAAAMLDSVIDTLYKKSRNRPKWQHARYVLDEVLTEDTDLLDSGSEILKAVDIQIARYQQLFRDSEAAAHDLAQEERDDARYGSYGDQVRDYYYATR